MFTERLCRVVCGEMTGLARVKKTDFFERLGVAALQHAGGSSTRQPNSVSRRCSKSLIERDFEIVNLSHWSLIQFSACSLGLRIARNPYVSGRRNVHSKTCTLVDCQRMPIRQDISDFIYSFSWDCLCAAPPMTIRNTLSSLA